MVLDSSDWVGESGLEVKGISKLEVCPPPPSNALTWTGGLFVVEVVVVVVISMNSGGGKGVEVGGWDETGGGQREIEIGIEERGGERGGV